MSRSASMLALSIKLSLSLVGSVLLMGNASATQEPRVGTSIAINQFENGALPEDEVQGLVNQNDTGNELAIQNDLEAQQRRRFLRIQTAFAVAVGLSALSLAYGVHSYSRQHRWQRIEFLRRATREFENDPGIAQALKILDFEEYRDYSINASQNPDGIHTSFKVTNKLLSQALASPEDRKSDTLKQENIKQSNSDLSPLEKETPISENLYAESSIRDWFNQMLNGLEHFGYMVDSGAFTIKEVKPWLNYWVRLIADENYRRNCDSRVYDRLYNYIYDHGFEGVRKLFEKFGYRIVRSPYKKTDFKDLGDVTQYDTKLALSMAKISRLVYQDMDYVEEIAELWGVKDIHHDSQYFNTKKRDTQAFIFRTDEFMVLAFRGTQEIGDWNTNLNTELRNFTIRKKGITTISSYRGKVHKGFFLGWADIERPVLAKLEFWRKKNNGIPLPPLLITGHSLGGALATMAAASLLENGFTVAGLYTFGQPRVGDRAFIRQLDENLANKVFRFINNNDVVPHVPPPFSFRNPMRLYGHLGAVKYFNSKGFLVANYKGFYRAFDSLMGFAKSVFESGLDLISDHSMSYYISNLDKALEDEEKNDRAKELEESIERVGRVQPTKQTNSTKPIKNR